MSARKRYKKAKNATFLHTSGSRKGGNTLTVNIYSDFLTPPLPLDKVHAPTLRSNPGSATDPCRLHIIPLLWINILKKKLVCSDLHTGLVWSILHMRFFLCNGLMRSSLWTVQDVRGYICIKHVEWKYLIVKTEKLVVAVALFIDIIQIDSAYLLN